MRASGSIAFLSVRTSDLAHGDCFFLSLSPPHYVDFAVGLIELLSRVGAQAHLVLGYRGFVIAWTWSLSSFSEFSLLLRECSLAETICFPCLINAAVGIRTGSNVVFVAALVGSIVMLHRHRVLLVPIEVLASHAVAHARSQRPLFRVSRIVISGAWAHPH